jgi:hypothetical protein
MQTYGLGTALKILLGYKNPYKRNELVALFNVFNKVSMSVQTYFEESNRLANNQSGNMYLFVGGALFVLVYLYISISRKRTNKKIRVGKEINKSD